MFFHSTATLGLYQALQTLGFRPYHLFELAMFGSDAHVSSPWESARGSHSVPIHHTQTEAGY
jgi:hypothetical protein